MQYLNEAHASELALVRVLQSQIAMTPRGSYRSVLETTWRDAPVTGRFVKRGRAKTSPRTTVTERFRRSTGKKKKR